MTETANRPHKHAKLMKLAAEQAAEREDWWRGWWCRSNSRYDRYDRVAFHEPFIFRPEWDYEYRWAPLYCNGVEIHPLMVEPEPDEPVWMALPGETLATKYMPPYYKYFNQHRLYATREDAQVHADAMLITTAAPPTDATGGERCLASTQNPH